MNVLYCISLFTNTLSEEEPSDHGARARGMPFVIYMFQILFHFIVFGGCTASPIYHSTTHQLLMKIEVQERQLDQQQVEVDQLRGMEGDDKDVLRMNLEKKQMK